MLVSFWANLPIWIIPPSYLQTNPLPLELVASLSMASLSRPLSWRCRIFRRASSLIWVTEASIDLKSLKSQHFGRGEYSLLVTNSLRNSVEENSVVGTGGLGILLSTGLVISDGDIPLQRDRKHVESLSVFLDGDGAQEKMEVCQSVETE